MRRAKTLATNATLFVVLCFLINCASQDQPANETLLEVNVRTSGWVTFKGEVLLLRVYGNGEAEADVLSSRTQNETKFERRKFTLSESDRAAIGDLLQILNEADVDHHYAPHGPASDIHSATTIRLKGRDRQGTEILIEENASGVLTDDYGNMYPTAIVNLLRFVQQLRHQIEAA